MSSGDETIRALRDAIQVSPNNLPLRQHLADTLLSLGRPEEAEPEYREALSHSPDNPQLKIGLASAFYQQGKDSHALVIVEDLLKNPHPLPRAYLLHARLLYRAGEVARAVQTYHKALDADPSSADADLAALLGIGPGSESREIVEGKVRAAWEDVVPAQEPSVERPKISFKDVGGMEALKDEIRMKIIYPLKNPKMYQAYGKAIGGGILMYGPPGCGKTYLARATAGEIGAGFLAVGIHEVLDMWIGSSERNLHELFEQARRNRPCVLFFDEVDALGASRADMRQNAGRHLINQFLAEMDGVQASNEGMLIRAATNAPWHLDSAFRRPGRFDRILFVPPPDVEARSAILRIVCRGKPIGEIDYDFLNKKTEGFSGADLKAVVDVAVEEKLKEAMREGAVKSLTTKDLADAVSRTKSSTREWFSTARNYALYSNQGGIYDDILKHLKL